MKINLNEQKRFFSVGEKQDIIIEDCGKIHLNPDQQVTFVTDDNKEYDVCRKEWGFYATPSLNGRLDRFNLRGALVKNAKGLIYLLLVEKDKEKCFVQYLEEEKQEFLKWLPNLPLKEVCFCGSWDFQTIHTFTSSPAGEINLNISNYYRQLDKCVECGHIYSQHSHDLDNLYNHDYVNTVYGKNLSYTFEKIISLPNEQSDNFGRVKRITEFVKCTEQEINVLDVGSGLCVFLYALKKNTRWDCYALDPDENQVKHAASLGIKTIHADFNNFESSVLFDLITFNKVLEHVKKPQYFLEKAKKYLSKNGIIYVEVPDGEQAFKDSPEREEFYIEHYHAFSFGSLAALLKSCGYQCLEISRIREPSGKYTLTCFARKN